MLILLTLTSLLYPIPMEPGTWRGPGEMVWGGFGVSYDVTEDHRVDLRDFASFQNDFGCSGRWNMLRPSRMVLESCP